MISIRLDCAKAPRVTFGNGVPTAKPQRILVSDDNSIFRETLAQWLRAEGHEVITAATGVGAFLALRDRSRPVGWLYTRAILPGLIDGSILADAYHETHRNRPAIISGAGARVSAQGDFVLKQPTPTAAFNAICNALASRETVISTAAESRDTRHAA